MRETIEKFFCDRCGKEYSEDGRIKHPYYIKVRTKSVITKWDDRRQRFIYADICKSCAESFNEWWEGGKV